MGSGDDGCSRAGEEVWAEPTLFAGYGVLCGYDIDEAEVGFDVHELVFDDALHGPHAGCSDHLFFFGKNVFQESWWLRILLEFIGMGIARL